MRHMFWTAFQVFKTWKAVQNICRTLYGTIPGGKLYQVAFWSNLSYIPLQRTYSRGLCCSVGRRSQCQSSWRKGDENSAKEVLNSVRTSWLVHCLHSVAKKLLFEFLQTVKFYQISIENVALNIDFKIAIDQRLILTDITKLSQNE